MNPGRIVVEKMRGQEEFMRTLFDPLFAKLICKNEPAVLRTRR
jgi:hypothetical protein